MRNRPHRRRAKAEASSAGQPERRGRAVLRRARHCADQCRAAMPHARPQELGASKFPPRNGFYTSWSAIPEVAHLVASACAVTRKAKAAELPTRRRMKEIAVCCADVRRGRDARASTQNHLRAHELAVVLAEGTG